MKELSSTRTVITVCFVFTHFFISSFVQSIIQLFLGAYSVSGTVLGARNNDEQQETQKSCPHKLMEQGEKIVVIPHHFQIEPIQAPLLLSHFFAPNP